MTYLTKNNLANNPFLFKSSTKLCNIILLYNNKRYMPKKPLPKDDVAKCIGALCPELASAITGQTPSQATNLPKNRNVLNNNENKNTETKTTITNNKEPQNNDSYFEQKQQQFLKESKNPLNSITDNINKSELKQEKEHKQIKGSNTNKEIEPEQPKTIPEIENHFDPEKW